MKQLLLDIQPAATPSLDNFVAGRNAEALHSLRLALNADSGSNAAAVRFIYLWGVAGSGKSHLLAACSAAANASALNIVCADDVHLLSDEQ
ncbi:MAG: DnaA regulatory inactivator Hda, partial [Methylophilaceae bacterium]